MTENVYKLKARVSFSENILSDIRVRVCLTENILYYHLFLKTSLREDGLSFLKLKYVL